MLTRELNRRTPTASNVAVSRYQDAFTNSVIVTYSIPIKPSIENETRFTGVLGIDITENLFQQVVLNAKVHS